MQNVCIIVPHADDETLGFGGAIQHHITQGDRVTVVICRSPHDRRTKEQIDCSNAALKILGVQHSCFLNHTEKDISNTPLNLFRSVESILEKNNPDIVYTTFIGDVHQDHRILFDCVARAIRVHGSLKVRTFLTGEIPSSTDQACKEVSKQFIPNYYIPISQKYLHNKIAAMGAYTTESRLAPHPRSPEYIECLARMRGIECGSKYAEAFMLMRQIL